MFSIDLTLKYSPIPLSVQRKESDAAQTLYQEILTALKADSPQLIELTCDKDPEKQIAVMSDQIVAVIVSQKDGTSTGRAPGFFMQS